MNRTLCFIALTLICGTAALNADVNIWSVPPSAASVDPAQRKDWKRIEKAAEASGRVVIENERICLILDPAAASPVLSTIDGGVRVSFLPAGFTGTVGAVTLKDFDLTEAAATLSMGRSRLEMSLRAGAPHAELKLADKSAGLELNFRSRFIVEPNFVGEDTVYDASFNKAATIPAPLKTSMLAMQEDGNGIVALMWKDSAEPGMAAATGAAQKDVKTRTVTLLTSSRSGSRAFTSATIESAGKPLYLGLLQSKAVWKHFEARKLPGDTPSPAGWSKPFEAAWKVDMHVVDYDKKEIDSFLKEAAATGLSKDMENDWRNFYMTLDASIKETDPLRVEASFFKSVDKDGKLPPLKSGEQDDSERRWPFTFKGQDAVLTIPAEWPCYPDPTKERLQELIKQRTAAGKEPPHPIHVYSTVLVYPLDRTDKTPLDRLTVVDLMRQALGIGPCKLDWLGNCQ